jgi:hypothetical protein
VPASQSTTPAARTRVNDLIPEGASVFTGASETLRLSGIDADINTSGQYRAVKPRVLAMDRVTGADEIRRLLASVHAVTETGSLGVTRACPPPSVCANLPVRPDTGRSEQAKASMFAHLPPAVGLIRQEMGCRVVPRPPRWLPRRVPARTWSPRH